MLSGRFTHHCAAWNNYKGLDPGEPTLFDTLQQGDYQCCVLGKTDYVSGRHTVRARVTAWTRSARCMRPQYRMPGPQVTQDGSTRVHERDWQDVDTACRWLHGLPSAAERDHPFFLYVGIRAPHPRFTTSDRYLDRIDPDCVAVPPLDQSPHPSLVYQRCSKNWLHGLDPATVRQVRRIYLAMIAEVDAMVGQLLQALADTGHADSTWVIFGSDHGELALEHGQFYKMSPYEGSSHVPLIIRGPEAQRGVAIDTPVSLVDLYPTLTDWGELEQAPLLDGYSLNAELTGAPTEHPGWALTEYHDTSCETGMFMLRQDRWKYVVYSGQPCQLFDVYADVWEMDDLSTTRPDVVAEMDARLRQVVAYERVDRKVKEYDRASFARWREERQAAGDYQSLMARIFSGWDGLQPGQEDPWTEADEERLLHWLNAG